LRRIKPNAGACAIRIGVATFLSITALILHGCSHESQQQQFMNALNRGNGAQASQLWLNMSAKDRSNLSHNVGFKQEATQDDVQRALLKHQKEEAAKNGDDQDADSDISQRQVDMPGLESDPAANSLSNLSTLGTLQQSAPITTIPVQ
jgi:hypothetical protein